MERKVGNLLDLNLAKHIKGQKCVECDQVFNDEELKDQNYTVWFSEDYQWNKNSEGEQSLTLIVRCITHEHTSYYDCPDVEVCQGCDNKFRIENMKTGLYEEKGEATYYCEPCFNKKYGEYLKARSERKQLTPEQKEALKIVQKALNEHLNSEYHKTPGNGQYGTCKGSECEGYKLMLESYGYDREQ